MPYPHTHSSQSSEGLGEEEGEDEADMPTTLEAALSHLGLTELTDVFLNEQFDFDSLVWYSVCQFLSNYTHSLSVSVSMFSVDD